MLYSLKTKTVKKYDYNEQDIGRPIWRIVALALVGDTEYLVRSTRGCPLLPRGLLWN
jgi:hypothetical protein